MKNLSLTAAILKAIHYADIFDYPLTLDEIQKYLVQKKAERVVFEEELPLIYTAPYYSLPGREEIIKIRQKRRLSSRSKLKKAKRVAAVLKFIPWIKVIGITGALAMENCDEDDDIDLMIITSPQRLWLTRGLVVGFLRLTGQYRRPQKVKDRICPNLLISEDALEFPDHDLFTAHEIVQMKPIYDRENTYQEFLQANQWVEDFLPNAIESAKVNPPVADQMSKLKLKSQNYFFDFLEKIAHRLQLKYMEKKKTVEVTTPSVIRFHPQDIRQKVLDEYQKRVYDVTK